MSSSFLAGGGTAKLRTRQVLVSAAIALSTPVLAQSATPALPPAGAASSAGAASVPSEEHPLLKEASEALESKNPAHALRLLDLFLVDQPDDSFAHSLRSRALSELGRQEEAVEASRRATNLSPGDAEYWNGLCWNLILAHRPLEARPACEKSREIRPDNWEPIVNLGHTWLLVGDAETAKRYYRDTIWRVPDEPALLAGPLADFDLFRSKGWQPLAALAGKQWFEQSWPRWQTVEASIKQVQRLNAGGQTGNAIAPAQQVLQMALDVLGDDLEVVATLMGWVAGMHESLAQYALALPLCQRAIVIFEKVKGPDHPTTGTSLNNLAGLYLAMGEYAQAEPLYQRALAISEKAEGPDHPNTGRNLNNLSVLYQDMGQYSKAIPLLRRALAISEKTQGADHPSTGAVLNNLSLLYQHMGEYANALPLVQRALAISERSEGADHPNTSARRNNLAVLYRDLGRYNQALPLFQRALVISEKVEGPDHPTTGTVLNNLATLYQDMGQYTLALPLIQRALAISEKAEGPDHPATGRVLNNLSLLYTEMGQYALALPLLQRALAISEKAEGPNHPSTGTRLVNLAVLYQDLGQYAQALPLFERAMAISVKVGGPEHPITGTVLTHLAELHRAMGQYAQALPLSQRALAISEKVHGTDHPSTGTSLNGLANLHWSMGHYAQALPLSQRALAISDKALGSDHPSTGRRLNNLARLYLDMGQFAQALPLFYRAEQIGTASWNRELQWHAQSGIAALLAAQGDPTSAIFWGKQAVNTIQSLRGGLIKLDRELQTSFLNDKRWVYTELSQQLITAGRIPEAQRVMALLKEEELFDFVRRDADSAPASSELPLTGVERKAAEQYKVLGDRLATLAQEELRLQEIRRKGGATEADLARLAELEAPLAEARDAFMAFTTGLRQMLAGQAEHREKAALVDRQIESHQNLLAELGSAGQGVAAVQYVASREKLSIIVSTQAIQLAREVPIAEKDLNKHIAELRGLLQDPKLDPRAAAQRLHALLIEPILADLQAQNVHTLMLLQDGALRYLPFAALHDGRRYLVENYQLAIYTAAAQSGLGKSPAAQWQVAALGVTRAFPEQNFRALDAVRQELNGIVHPQVLPGQVYLDEKFNRTTLLNNLGRPVLHVASHFRFIEGSDQSFLLLGDGSRLSLADLRRMPRFNGVDLLTLSACDTATGGGLREDGREVEGLGAEVQKKGARAVLATLWPVADRSTGELMQRFYRAREGGQRNKAQALRQAQLALLGAAGGDAGSAGPNEPRGARPVAAAPGGGEGKPAPYVAPAGAPYAHPYYWAPFILMGNWL